MGLYVLASEVESLANTQFIIPPISETSLLRTSFGMGQDQGQYLVTAASALGKAEMLILRCLV